MTAYLRVFLLTLTLGLVAMFSAAADDSVLIGTARVDVTPDGPIRLAGYASRKTESEGVAQRLWVKALAIGARLRATGPAVLMMVENCGVPGSLTAEVAGRLQAKAGVASERFVVCSTHIHSGPWLPGFAPDLMPGEPLPPSICNTWSSIDANWPTRWNRRPWPPWRRGSRAGWPGARARCGFAMNRRPIDKKESARGWASIRPGPVDPSLPVLCASNCAREALGDRRQLRLPLHHAGRRFQSHPRRLGGHGPAVYRSRASGARWR